MQRFQVAHRELALEAVISRLERSDLLILDDIAHVNKDPAETSVLLISACYERHSLLITTNQPFVEWGMLSLICRPRTTPVHWSRSPPRR